MCTATTRRPSAARPSRHSATRGMFSLHVPQLTDQKCTSTGWPLASASAAAPVALNHSVAPSSEGISVPILIGMSSPRRRVPGFRFRVPVKTHFTGTRNPSPDTHPSDLQSLLTRTPLGLAQTAGLQSLYDAQRLVGRAPDVEVVYDRVAERPLGVDDEEAAQRHSLVLDEHAVVARHRLRDVGRERVAQVFDAALVARGLEPRAVRGDRAGRGADD